MQAAYWRQQKSGGQGGQDDTGLARLDDLAKAEKAQDGKVT